MNAYIPVLDQQPPAGFVCNATLAHIGPSVVRGHTPPRQMEIMCPCLDCVIDYVVANMQAAGVDEQWQLEALNGFVLGPVWFGHENPYRDPAEMVGIYRRSRIENK